MPSVRFGSETDSCSAATHVCFGPKADIASLVDHVVGTQQDRLWDCDADRFGGLEIDH